MKTPILLYVVTEDWYFLSHRLPMALAARDAGYEVHVATRVRAGGAEIERQGFRLHPLDWPRGSYNPVTRIANIRAVRSLYRELSPDIVHHVAMEAAIVGSIAALGLPIVRLNALAGLGFAFTSQTVKARMTGGLMARLLSWLLNRPAATALVQNEDDRRALAGMGVGRDRIFLIPGSGVDTRAFAPLPEPSGPFTVGFVGRLLDDKGIRVLLAAQDILTKTGRATELLIAGEPDPANPASVSPGEIASWRQRAGIRVLGHVQDIRQVWARAHIGVLPSRREGLPKSLLEAAACGRPLVATDVPGCREIARRGINALLVPPDDPSALAAAIAELAGDEEMRRRFGAASRGLVEREFSAERVGTDIVALYRRLLDDRPLQATAQSG